MGGYFGVVSKKDCVAELFFEAASLSIGMYKRDFTRAD